jgi:regulatory protein
VPEVTGVRERRGKIRVFVDGEFWAEIDAGVAAERGLYEGTVLSVEELGEARVAGERALAMSCALGFLGYRARSTTEVRDRLRRYGYAEETIEEVVGRLVELGYLDDEEFARDLARQKARKYGPRQVTMDLRRGGIEPELARGVVEQEFAGRSELEAASTAATRRYNTGERSDAQARRVYGFLTRRGYSANVCAEVAREFRGRGAEEGASGAGE